MSIDTIKSPDELASVCLPNLKDIFGEGWISRVTSPSLSQSLQSEGITDFSQATEMVEATTPKERFAVDLNSIFDQHQLPYHTTIFIDSRDRQKLLIVGQIDGDILYQTVTAVNHRNDPDHGDYWLWAADTMGLVGATGQVLRIDKIAAEMKSGFTPGFVFLEFSDGERYEDAFRSEIGYCSGLPRNQQQIFDLAHELGHSIFRLALRRDEYALRVLAVAETMFRKNLSDSPDQFIYPTPLQARQIVAQNERSSWALGLSLVKEAGRPVGLNCASTPALKKGIENAEESLSSHGTTPFPLPSDSIPQFSSEARKITRQ